MYYVNTLGWFSEKLSKFWDWFRRFVDKYIGSGITAMLITLVLIIIAIAVIKKFTSKQVVYMDSKECEILQVEEPVTSKSEYICVLILLLISIFLLIYMMEFM